MFYVCGEFMGLLLPILGYDRFAFHVFERGKGYLLEFPNFTVGYCPELLSTIDAAYRQ